MRLKSTDKAFEIAILVSLIAHTAIFIRLPSLNFRQKKPVSKKPELTYVKTQTNPSRLSNYDQRRSQKEVNEALNKKILPKMGKQQALKKVRKASVDKPKLSRPPIIAVRKKITLPTLTDKKITNAVYVAYYAELTDRIRVAAYKNYTILIHGEVTLTFVVLRNGQLKSVHINEAKSTANRYLKDIAKNTLRDAAPFPPLPPELDAPELSFTLTISFETE